MPQPEDKVIKVDPPRPWPDPPAADRRKELVDHPAHYGGADNPYEAIKVIEAWSLNFSLGSALKYICRAGKKTEARSVFPNALASRIIITYNLRTWRHFFLMRTSKEAHPQMRQVTIPLLEEFKKRIPVLYEDIEPECRQIDNMRKPR